MTIVIALAYLVAAVLFILGLKQLSSPKSARNGNFIAAGGMVIALLATIPLLHFTKSGLEIIGIGILIGAVVGTVGAVARGRPPPASRRPARRLWRLARRALAT